MYETQNTLLRFDPIEKYLQKPLTDLPSKSQTNRTGETGETPFLPSEAPFFGPPKTPIFFTPLQGGTMAPKSTPSTKTPITTIFNYEPRMGLSIAKHQESNSDVAIYCLLCNIEINESGFSDFGPPSSCHISSKHLSNTLHMWYGQKIHDMSDRPCMTKKVIGRFVRKL